MERQAAVSAAAGDAWSGRAAAVVVARPLRCHSAKEPSGRSPGEGNLVAGKFFTPSAGIADFTESLNASVLAYYGRDVRLQIDEFVGNAAFAKGFTHVPVAFCCGHWGVDPEGGGKAASARGRSAVERAKSGKMIVMGCRHWLPIPDTTGILRRQMSVDDVQRGLSARPSS